jgi:hypothetical protein
MDFRGGEGGERLNDLQERLDELPADLEMLFLKILESLDSKKVKRAGQLFQLINRAIEPLTLLEMSFADEDPSFFWSSSVNPLTQDKEQARAEIMRRRINECGKGLIEADGQRYRRKANPKATVSYLHRTVRDYLRSDTNTSKLWRDVDSTFDPFLQLCSARLSLLKSAAYDNSRKESHIDFEIFFWDCIKRCLVYARRFDTPASRLQVSLLDELDRTGRQITTTPGSTGITFLQRTPFSATYWTCNYVAYTKCSDFLQLARKTRLDGYIEAKKLPSSA